MMKPFVGVARFELTISWSQTKRDTGLRYTPNFLWRREGIKRFSTSNLFFVIRQGIEPRTVRLEI